MKATDFNLGVTVREINAGIEMIVTGYPKFPFNRDKIKNGVGNVLCKWIENGVEKFKIFDSDKLEFPL